jgi:hypothetical protein
MKKRALVTGLWFFAGWYAGNVLAYALGVSELLGPIVGTAAAVLIATDPRHLLWAPSEARSRSQARLAATTIPTFDADRLS